MLDVTTSHPLSRWVVGRLKLHFDGGSVVERNVHLDEARRIRQVLDGEQESDALMWHALRWLQWDASRVVFTSFDVAEDGGWALDPDEREALVKAGHPHGILHSLVAYWSEQEGEPKYSLFSLYELHRAAVAGMTRKDWEEMARRGQGDRGTQRLLDAALGAKNVRPPSVQADDDAQPAASYEPTTSAAPEPNPTQPTPTEESSEADATATGDGEAENGSNAENGQG